MSTSFEKFTNKLVAAGNYVSEVVALKVIKDAFMSFMPITIIGAMATLWTAVICNSTNGLGRIWSPIMNLSFLNPLFSAVNFCTLGCISVGIAFLIGSNLGKEKGLRQDFCGLLAALCFFTVLPLAQDIMADDGTTTLATVKGVFETSLNSKGLFTAIIVALFAITIFAKLSSLKQLKITMPEMVPGNVAKSFEELIPAALTVIIVAAIGFATHYTTGLYLNEVISAVVQKPLMKVGGSLPGMLIFEICIVLFWSVGIHGESMVNGIMNPIITALLLENTALVEAGEPAKNIINWAFFRTFTATGGTGVCLGLTLALFLVGKREDNRAIAKITIVPNMFNICEVNMFGLPIALNPILMIPFILTPLVCIVYGYFMTAIGICPVMYVQMPWTMPPFLMGFFSAGGSVAAGLVQLGAVAISTLIYTPFIIAYEKQQNAADQARALENKD